MAHELKDDSPVFLSTLLAGRGERRLALAVLLISAVVFFALVPFAKIPLATVPAFIPLYESALVINDLITAVLLFGQFSILRSKALLVLASGYLFTAFMTVSHALTFPGVFSPSGLLSAGPQSSPWIYSFWHGGFPLCVIAYALLKGRAHDTLQSHDRPWVAVLSGVVAVFVTVCGFTLLATAGQDALPAILLNYQITPLGYSIFTSVWVLSTLALAALWRRQPHSVLDLWLMVVMCAWTFDIALSSVLNAARFDLGWYAGRIYGLLAASFVLMVLLLENSRLYFRLVETHEMGRQKATDLKRLNALIEARIEERTAALDALHDKEEELKAIVENMLDCVITIDTRGIVRSANPAVERILGYAVGEVIGKNVSMLMPEPHGAAHDGYLDNYRRTGLARIIGIGREVEGLHKNGERIALDLAISEYHVKEQRFFVGTLRDIRERKRFIAELTQARADAEQANHAKANFLAAMSHEIRTPMNAILGLAYLLEKAALPGDANEMVHKIRMAGRSLLGIINDILDFSKIESGKLEIEMAPFRLGDVLDNLSTIMSANASEKELELIISPSPSKTNQLRGDALRLEQVLINLTSNAIKFTEHGHVAMSISVVSEDEQQVTLRFAVRDTGIGIAPDKQQKIFSPFSQADDSVSRRFGGTGLGLTISRQLVTRMGGELQVTSVPGSGSEFFFVLTFERGHDTWLATPEMAHLAVLIADDNPIAREALCSMVDGLGWTATAVSSGEAALRHVQAKQNRRKPREVLLLDYKMPGMDGLDTARAIRHELKEAGDPIIIMVTAYSSHELLAHPDRQLADAVLSKPVTPSILYNAVARAMRVRQGGEEQAPSRSQQRLAGLRIQVVDDSEINREVAQRILVGEGAQVVLANNGQQAVDWLQAHSGEVDIVLMDVQMPVMNGYEATRQIRRVPALANLPVIALTAGAFMEQQDLAHEAGMTSFIAKPFDVDAAIALIIKLTGRIAQVSSAKMTAPPATEQDLPGLAVGHGLTIWKSPSAYRQYLRSFVRDYGDIAQQMARSDKTEAATLAHKIKGAAGSLALQEVAALAGEVGQVLHAGENPTHSLLRLQAALDTALTSIERYAPPDAQSEAVVSDSFDPGQVAPLLAQMLAACNADSPSAVLPVLAELGQVLPSAHLAALHLVIENFDFRGGESATRTLAENLDISLGA